MATAELLGQRATVFPSHHGGFLGGESEYAGQPEAFACKLRDVLDETTDAGATRSRKRHAIRGFHRGLRTIANHRVVAVAKARRSGHDTRMRSSRQPVRRDRTRGRCDRPPRTVPDRSFVAKGLVRCRGPATMKAITPGGMIRASGTGSRLLASAVRRKREPAISRVYGGAAARVASA